MESNRIWCKLLVRLSVVVLMLSFVACNGGKSNTDMLLEGDTITTNASLLTIIDFSDYTIVDVENPWSRGERLQRYILVDQDKDNQKLPDGILVKVPLRSSLVYSSVHAGAIKEIGKIACVTAVCDAQYYKIPEICEGLRSGSVTDVGASMSPMIERILEHEPEAILTSPFQNAGHGAIEQLNIPIIECADYMESTPLGRAEWIKFIGRLYGNADKADSIYQAVAENYQSLSRKIANTDRPIVISEMVTDGVWYLPGGNSYMAQMFRDAGADYPWNDDASIGSLQLDFATVYDKAHNADYWFIKTFDRDLTLDELRENYPLHERMSAFHKGGVYSCNTATSSFFEDFPFHPDLLLHDFINIMHPGVLSDSTLHYYHQVK